MSIYTPLWLATKLGQRLGEMLANRWTDTRPCNPKLTYFLAAYLGLGMALVEIAK